MRRVLTTMGLALSCASMLTLQSHAQSSETETRTKVKTEHATQVTYTGCVQSGTQTRTFVLQNVAPVRRTETIATPGGSVTTTTYELLPEGKVELQQQVGHKVEVTGVLIPAGNGESKITTRTKTNGKEEKTTSEIDRGATSQLRVVSVRPLGESCS
jgi:hypothetical protein